MTAAFRLTGLSEQVHKALAERLDPAATPEQHDEIADITLGRWTCVLLGVLGVPRRDWLQVSCLADEADDAVSRAALDNYIDVMVADRCWRPTDDLLSDLIFAEVDGDGFTADEIKAIVVALLTT
jgi:cytochrome P450